MLDRVKYASAIAWFLVALAAYGVFIVIFSGGPRAFSAGEVLLPSVLLLFSGYFFWQARSACDRGDDG